MNRLGGKSLNDEIVVNNLYTPARIRMLRLREHLFVLKEYNSRSSFCLQDRYLLLFLPMAITQAVALRQQLRSIYIVNMASTSLLLTISFDAREVLESNFYACRVGIQIPRKS